MLERERLEELERIKEMERRQLIEFEKQKQAERERAQILALERKRVRENREKEELEKMRQEAIQQEVDRQRELERQRQSELNRQKQRELETQRQKQLDFERQELENQRERKAEADRERQRLEELERTKDMERRQLFEFDRQRVREKMEKEQQEMRQEARQLEAERQRILERQRRETQDRGHQDHSPLRPQVLDIDSVSLGDQHSRGSPKSPGARWKPLSPRGEDLHRPGVLDIDSFRSQTQPSPNREVFTVTGIQGLASDSGARSHPQAVDRDSSRRMVPEGMVRRSNSVWAPSQLEHRLLGNEVSVDRPMDGPETPRKPANKPTLEQLLYRQERPTAPMLVQERRWSGVPTEQSFSRREPQSPGLPMEQTWFLQDSEPQGRRIEARGQRRSQGSKAPPECRGGEFVSYQEQKRSQGPTELGESVPHNFLILTKGRTSLTHT
ncbi:hypothetical protein UPYG_G00186130 [Umbra pygmaea]|uniref:Uncharacterized protein n=1 Tax=Umbra pygmaea TaxID=75934 RepID=A0ABD0WT92_UMBPY